MTFAERTPCAPFEGFAETVGRDSVIEDLIDAGDVVVTRMRAHVTGAHSGLEGDGCGLQPGPPLSEKGRGPVLNEFFWDHRGSLSKPPGSRGVAMSQAIPPLETIRAGFDAFNRCDYDAWGRRLDDEDVEFFDPLPETPRTPGTFRGHNAGVRAWASPSWQEAWGEGFRFEPRSIMQGDDAVVVDNARARSWARKRPSRSKMTPSAHRPALNRDQKVVCRPNGGCIDRAQALEARRAAGVGCSPHLPPSGAVHMVKIGAPCLDTVDGSLRGAWVGARVSPDCP